MSVSPLQLRTVPARRSDAVVIIAAALAAFALGAGSSVVELLPALILAVALFVLVAMRPVVATYIYLAVMPFVTGMERGTGVPLLRPNESLQAFLTLAVLAAVYVRYVRGEGLRFEVTRLDRSIIVLATLASVWPLLWMLLRSEVPTQEDVLSAVVLWRLAALYALFRAVIHTREQVQRCLWIIMGGAAVLGIMATLQARGWIGLPEAFGTDVDTGRGGATLGSSIAVGDYVAYSLAVLAAMYLRHTAKSRLLLAIGAVLLLGSLGTGQFSAWIAAGVVIVSIAWHERAWRELTRRLLPLGVVALVIAWPVVATRLSGFEGGDRLQSSWLGRIDNLTNFYLPELAGFHWVLGVRPNAVLVAPETWRDQIFLESGILWLLWVGGVPLLVAYFWFLGRALRDTQRVARARTDEIGVAAVAAWGSLWAMAVLTIIDQHLTLRGGGDLLFVLLGLAMNRRVLGPGSEVVAAERSPDERGSP
jgi:hypothetical protein